MPPMRSSSVGLVVLLLFGSGLARSDTGLPPEMVITLHADDGTSIPIGKLQATREGEAYRIEVTLDAAKFEDKFLSMRPFKCLPHPSLVVCHLPYPYENKRRVTKNDVTDLEYDLLFLHKSPQEYGIDAWNGLYYDLEMTETGFIGELRETDLNVLAAPPEELRPIKDADLHPASDNHWPRRITIQ